MARRSSSKVAHSNELRSRQHRGYEYDLEARNDDRRDSDLMKRCTGIKNESRSTAGKLYRTIEDEPSNDLVKTWLANTGNLQSSVTISPTNIANSPKIHHRKSRQGYGDDVSIKTPYMNQDAWRSSQRSHKKGALLPLTGHTLHYHGRRCRKHPISDNSSLLSIAEDRREHAADPYPVRQNACINDDTPPRCTEGKVDTSDDKAYSRSSSPAAESSRFEKKKRYKTKDDRYDTKKQDRIVLDPGPQPHKSKKRKQDDKKKSLMSSKSVMKNFDPQAVLRDRITIPQSLEPGLFKNGREGALLPNRKRDSAPNSSSRKRLKRLEKQDKEIEELSSYFIPPTNGENNGCGEVSHLSSSKATTKIPSHVKSVPPCLDHGASETSVSGHYQPNEEATITVRLSDHGSPALQVISQDVSETSEQVSKSTTCFSWSTSPSRSSQQGRGQAFQTPSRLDTHTSITPESVRRVLLECGIFKNTGIQRYDESASRLNIKNKYASVVKDVPGSSEPQSLAMEDSLDSKHGLHDADLASNDQPPVESLVKRWKALMPAELHEHLRDGLTDSGKAQKNNNCKIQAGQVHVSSDVEVGIRVNSPGRIPVGVHDNLHVRDTWKHAHIDHALNNDVSQTHTETSVSNILRSTMPPPPIPMSRVVPCSVITSQDTMRGHSQSKHVPTKDEICAARKLIDGLRDNITNLSDQYVASGPWADSLPTVIKGSDGGFSSLQCASWLPRPHTPAATLLTGSTKISRNDTHNSLHMSQIAVQTEMCSPRDHEGNDGNTETMVEYIGRIERDVDERFSECDRDTHHGDKWNNIYQLEDIVGNFQCQHVPDTCDEYDRPLEDGSGALVFTLEQESLINRYGDGGLYRDDKTNDFHSLDANIYQRGIRPPLEEAYEQGLVKADEFAEEKAEMSQFWGRNHFVTF